MNKVVQRGLTKQQINKKYRQLFKQLKQINSNDPGYQNQAKLNRLKYQVQAIWNLQKQAGYVVNLSQGGRKKQAPNVNDLSSYRSQNREFAHFMLSIVTWLMSISFLNGYRRFQIGNSDTFQRFKSEQIDPIQQARYLHIVQKYFDFLFNTIIEKNEDDAALFQYVDLWRVIQNKNMITNKKTSQQLIWNRNAFAKKLIYIIQNWSQIPSFHNILKMQTIQEIIAQMQQVVNPQKQRRYQGQKSKRLGQNIKKVKKQDKVEQQKKRFGNNTRIIRKVKPAKKQEKQQQKPVIIQKIQKPKIFQIGVQRQQNQGGQKIQQIRKKIRLQDRNRKIREGMRQILAKQKQSLALKKNADQQAQRYITNVQRQAQINNQFLVLQNPLGESGIKQVIKLKNARKYSDSQPKRTMTGKLKFLRHYKGQTQYSDDPIKFLKRVYFQNDDNISQKDLVNYTTKLKYQKLLQSGIVGNSLFSSPQTVYQYSYQQTEKREQFYAKLDQFLGEQFYEFIILRTQQLPKISKYYIRRFTIWCYYQVISHNRRLVKFYKQHKLDQAQTTAWFNVFTTSWFWWAPAISLLQRREIQQFYQQNQAQFQQGWNSVMKNPRVITDMSSQNIFPRLGHHLSIPVIRPLLFRYHSRYPVIPFKQQRGQAFIRRQPNSMFFDWVSSIFYSVLVWITNSVVGLLLSYIGYQYFLTRGFNIANLMVNANSIAKNFSSTTFTQTFWDTHKIFLPRAWNHQFSFVKLFQMIGQIYKRRHPSIQQKMVLTRSIIMDYVNYAVCQQVTQYPSVYLSWIDQKRKNNKIDNYQMLLKQDGMKQQQQQESWQLGIPINGLSGDSGSYTINFFLYFQNWGQVMAILINAPPPRTNRTFLRQVFKVISINQRGIRQPAINNQRVWQQDWRHYSNYGHLLRVQQYSIWLRTRPNWQNSNCWVTVSQYLTSRNYLNFPSQDQHFQSILKISQWCQVYQFSVYFENYMSYNMDRKSKQVIYLSPCHIDIVTPYIFRKKAKMVDGVIININKSDIKQKQIIQQPLLSQQYRPVKWQIYKRFPYQKDFSMSDIVQFRTNSICIDFQCISVKKTTQIPYLVCVTGFPFSINQTLYIRFKDLYTTFNAITTFNPYQGQKIQHHPQKGSYQGQCVQYFIQWLARNSCSWTKQKPLYIYSFNGFRYQMVFLYHKLIKRFGRIDSLGPPRQSRGFSLLNGSINFIDGCKLVPGISLKNACQNYKTLVKKDQTLKIQLYDTWQLIQNRITDIQKYCIQDCVCTFLLIQKIYICIKSLYSKQRTINALKKKTTAPSLAWDYWTIQYFQKRLANSQNLQGQHIKSKADTYNRQPAYLYRLQRANYFGGIVQVYQYIVNEEIYPLDINSMYPYQMTNKMPWYYLGQIKDNFQQSLTQKDSDLYFYQISFFQFPFWFQFNFIPVKGKTRNEYYRSYKSKQGEQVCVWGHTLKLLNKIKANYCIVKGWRYNDNGQDSLARFSMNIYQKRKQAKKQGNEALSTVLKLLMNSLTGRLSMKQRNSGYTTAYWANHSDVQFQVQKSIYSEDFQYITLIGKKVLPQAGRLVRITSYITSASRKTLAQKAIIAGIGNFFYCDTDSLYVNKKGWQNLDCPSRKASQLGQLKLQLGQKQVFTQGYFFSRKFYILKRSDGTYKKKVKGIPQKFLTDQKVQTLINSLIQVQKNLKNPIPDGQITLVDQWGAPITIPIQFWRRNYKDSTVIIEQMDKKVNIQNDRGYEASRRVGWQLARVVSIPQYQGQQY